MSLDAHLEKLRRLVGSPSTGKTERWEALRFLAKSNLYFLCKGVLGFKDMVPHFHGVLCRELDSLSLPYGRRLDLWPRGHLKTHVITIGKSIQDYLKNNNTRILLAGANRDNSMKNLRKIKSIFESNPVMHWLFPECIPDTKGDGKWTETEVCLPRTENLPESTFKCIGVGGHITGWHFDIIRKDDLIDEKTEKSPEVMEKIIDWHLVMKNLLESPSSGVDHVIGTRWSMGDLYQFIIDKEKDYTHCTVAAINRKGKTVWPERFKLDALMMMREKDPYQFACQQMNNPRDESIVDFNAKWLRYYDFISDNYDIGIELAEV